MNAMALDPAGAVSIVGRSDSLETLPTLNPLFPLASINA